MNDTAFLKLSDVAIYNLLSAERIGVQEDCCGNYEVVAVYANCHDDYEVTLKIFRDKNGAAKYFKNILEIIRRTYPSGVRQKINKNLFNLDKVMAFTVKERKFIGFDLVCFWLNGREFLIESYETKRKATENLDEIANNLCVEVSDNNERVGT